MRSVRNLMESEIHMGRKDCSTSGMNRLALIGMIALPQIHSSRAMRSRLPDKASKLRAVGPLTGLPRELKRALEADSDFDPIRDPGPGDWLTVHPEAGQTYEDFIGFAWNRPDRIRKRIYLQPLGKFVEGYSPPVEMLVEYAKAFFTLETKSLPPLELDTISLTTRNNPANGRLQILTIDVLQVLQRRIPPDAFCILAVSMEDLYPGPSWNFVFGQASLKERVAVYSFARYDPAFYGEARGSDYRRLLMERSCRVLVHESSHMFGLHHCIYYRCVMNGSNHLRESDSRPLHLCPVCLRKLQYSIGFDVLDRYRNLLAFYQKAGLHDEAAWIEGRIRKITAVE